jgi:hypothetical protein
VDPCLYGVILKFIFFGFFFYSFGKLTMAEDSHDELDDMIQQADGQGSPGIRSGPPLDAKGERQRRSLVKQLKGLLIRNPNINITRGCEIDARLACLSIEDLENLLENIKIELNIIHPNENSKSLLAAGGTALEKFTGYEGYLVEPLVHDEELLGALEDMIPNYYDYFSGPIKVVTRVAKHISEASDRFHKGLPPIHFANPIPPPTASESRQASAAEPEDLEKGKKRKEVSEEDHVEERPKKRTKRGRNVSGGANQGDAPL